MTSAVPDKGLFEHSNPTWVTAKEIWLRGERYISVYRSVLVKDADPIYGDVASALRGAELIGQDYVYDKDMMFGRAEWLLYRL